MILSVALLIRASYVKKTVLVAQGVKTIYVFKLSLSIGDEQISAGSCAMNDVNYSATNDSNTPENSAQLSDISLPCRSTSFKCKSAFIPPRCRNSSLYTDCISIWRIDRHPSRKKAWRYGPKWPIIAWDGEKTPPKRHRAHRESGALWAGLK